MCNPDALLFGHITDKYAYRVSGLNIHTFHGNFFVRSTDLLALANTNPDAGFAVNLSIEEPLTDLSAVCFQAALLYTTSKVSNTYATKKIVNFTSFSFVLPCLPC